MCRYRSKTASANCWKNQSCTVVFMRLDIRYYIGREVFTCGLSRKCRIYKSFCSFKPFRKTFLLCEFVVSEKQHTLQSLNCYSFSEFIYWLSSNMSVKFSSSFIFLHSPPPTLLNLHRGANWQRAILASCVMCSAVCLIYTIRSCQTFCHLV